MANLVRFGRITINLDLVRDVNGLEKEFNLTAKEAAWVRAYLESMAQPWRPRVVWPDG